jgi:hypothetical protein
MNKLTQLAALTLALVCAGAWAADNPTAAAPAPPSAMPGSPSANNANAPGASDSSPRAREQTSRSRDRNLIAAVRRAVVRDKSLSTSAHNIKIVAKNGVVTLRGPVRSAEEKSKLEQLAQQVAGVSGVTNQLAVKQN